ncbi:MAG: HU family DNA-binding protein [Prosthecobacter sp.]|jgi:DNA-binding protein HU-beta|uniref:HU family DNA-binding protein n=1 Tax=Prosthecobacter sp. TaxID=1965333 RepID=UPI0019FAC15E|nr:HU family DNA-binding protein [Prosthecobacter sp.]MBE2283462.1 HU family DNA-binding protein [Prosthecobacter sp.]
MNKAQLIDEVQKILGGDTTKRAATEALDAVLDAIAGGLKEGPVMLVGFGTFKPVKRNARMGRNPKTKEPVEIKASSTVRFTPSAALKASV